MTENLVKIESDVKYKTEHEEKLLQVIGCQVNNLYFTLTHMRH